MGALELVPGAACAPRYWYCEHIACLLGRRRTCAQVAMYDPLARILVLTVHMDAMASHQQQRCDAMLGYGGICGACMLRSFMYACSEFMLEFC